MLAFVGRRWRGYNRPKGKIQGNDGFPPDFPRILLLRWRPDPYHLTAYWTLTMNWLASMAHRSRRSTTL